MSKMTNAKLNYQRGSSYASKKDFKKALKFFKLSADAGYVNAQFAVATYCHYNSKYGTTQNLQKAIKYYELSENQGGVFVHNARFNLGLCYEKMQKYKKAIEFFTLCDEPEHIERCEKELVKRFKIVLHANDIVYMYPLCVKYGHRDIDLLTTLLTREYTDSILLIPDLIELTISYLI